MKRASVIGILVCCLTFVAYHYLRNDEQEVNEDIYLKTVVFQDEDHDLIPVSINFQSQVEDTQEMKNRLDFMKSTDLKEYGLYPVFDSEFEILSLKKDNDRLVVDMNEHIGKQCDDLSFLEALTYVLTGYQNIEHIQLQINGNNISTLPHSDIPLASLNHHLGLNNFEETSYLLHETIPVMSYQEKVINKQSYYVPTTLRIDEKSSIFKQVQSVLNYVTADIQVLQVDLKNGQLKVELGSNILLDNETLDKTLHDLIILSLSSLKDVKDVKIFINQDEIRVKKASQIQYNHIKI